MARKERIDMVGLRYGRLFGLAFHETRRNKAHWLFQCDCGETTVANGVSVRSGKTSSCGCLHREVCAARLTIHGHRAKKRHPATYRAWQQINTYCTNPASPRFRDFGAVGVAVSPAWAGDFEVFLADMGERPAHTMLERLDPARDFAPDNCRWTPLRSRSARAIEGRLGLPATRPSSGEIFNGLPAEPALLEFLRAS